MKEVENELYGTISYNIESAVFDALSNKFKSVNVEAQSGDYFADVVLDICYRDIGQGKVYCEIPYVDINEVVVVTPDEYHQDIADNIQKRLSDDVNSVNSELEKSIIECV